MYKKERQNLGVLKYHQMPHHGLGIFQLRYWNPLRDCIIEEEKKMTRVAKRRKRKEKKRKDSRIEK